MSKGTLKENRWWCWWRGSSTYTQHVRSASAGDTAVFWRWLKQNVPLEICSSDTDKNWTIADLWYTGGGGWKECRSFWATPTTCWWAKWYIISGAWIGDRIPWDVQSGRLFPFWRAYCKGGLSCATIKVHTAAGLSLALVSRLQWEQCLGALLPELYRHQNFLYRYTFSLRAALLPVLTSSKGVLVLLVSSWHFRRSVMPLLSVASKNFGWIKLPIPLKALCQLSLPGLLLWCACTLQDYYVCLLAKAKARSILSVQNCLLGSLSMWLHTSYILHFFPLF